MRYINTILVFDEHTTLTSYDFIKTKRFIKAYEMKNLETHFLDF